MNCKICGKKIMETQSRVGVSDVEGYHVGMAHRTCRDNMEASFAHRLGLYYKKKS